MTRGIRLKWSSPRTRYTHTYRRVFSSGAVTTCFYDLGLSRLGFEHPTFRLRGQRSNPLRHPRGLHVGVNVEAYDRIVFDRDVNSKAPIFDIIIYF